MGWNTVVLVLNDAMSSVVNDKGFGQKVSDAVSEVNMYHKPADISSGSFVNAATVISTEHANVRRLLLTGENWVEDLGAVHPYGKDDDIRVRVLKALADNLGYRVSKKRVKK